MASASEQPALHWLALFEAAHDRLREAEASLSRARTLAASERGLEPLVEIVRDVALARRRRTGGSAVLRAREALAAVEGAATDAELRVALRLVSSWLDQRSSATTGQ